MMRHVPEYDGWRGLAIACLLVGHFFAPRGVNFGTVGVNLFFVLSGLLMGRILFVERQDLATFYRRRIARIVPATLVFIGSVTLGYAVLGRTIDGRELLAALTFMNNYFHGKPDAPVMPFGHIWSLSVEEHSYIVLSLAALVVGAGLAGARRAVLALAAATVAAGLYHFFTYAGIRLEFDRWIHTEVAAYGIFVSAWCLIARVRMVRGWAVPACLAAGVCLHWWSVPVPVRTFVGVGLFALAVNNIESAPAVVRAILSSRVLRQLGLWSFSVYLWQQPFHMYVAFQHKPPLLGLLGALLAGAASFYLVEQPARRWLTRRRSEPAAIVPALGGASPAPGADLG